VGEITVIYDNRTARDDLYPGWGFSALIEMDGRRLLFDTGGDKIVLEHNAAALGVDLRKTGCLFFSHEHCDHVGAVSSALHAGLTVVYPASFSRGFRKRIEDAKLDAVPITAPIEFMPGFHSTGELGTEIVEQSLIVDGNDGPVIITGCAHPGIVNIARVAAALAERPLSLIVGGFHLGARKGGEVRQIAAALRALGVARVGPCHCTGERAIAILAEEFADQFVDVRAGTRIPV